MLLEITDIEKALDFHLLEKANQGSDVATAANHEKVISWLSTYLLEDATCSYPHYKKFCSEKSVPSYS